MRTVVQLVKSASVEVDNIKISEISTGLLIFVGVEQDDEQNDINYLCDKITNLRIFKDKDDKMNLSIIDVGGQILLVSQFTLYGDCRKGRRPSYDRAAEPVKAEQMYLELSHMIKKAGIEVVLGKFRADMQVSILNDGPVTILMDSKKVF